LLASLEHRLGSQGWRVVSAVESDWRLNVSVVRNSAERVLMEINFEKQGLASTIRALKFSQPGLPDEIRGALQ
jgi:hypothetical protein